MNLLLDTHTFLWWVQDDRSLAASARAAISDVENTVVVSTVTIWEIAIKRNIGKLSAPADTPDHVALNGFQTLAIDLGHAWLAGNLPPLHNDPFDRMLVAQAQIESLTIVTRDPRIMKYDVPVLTA